MSNYETVHRVRMHWYADLDLSICFINVGLVGITVIQYCIAKVVTHTLQQARVKMKSFVTADICSGKGGLDVHQRC